MGSNQSSASKGPQSFSIDPSGNISRRTTAVASNEPDNNSTTLAQQIAEPQLQTEKQVTEEPQAFVGSMPEPTIVASKNTDLSLAEAEEIVNSIQARYEQRQASAEQLGDSNEAALQLERKIVQCYRSNPNQTMNCSSLYKNYQDYVVEKRRRLLSKHANNHRLTPQLVSTAILVITCLLLHLTTVHCLGAMSVDLGSEWMKVGLVAPSVQMDIVLNSQSQRKTPMAIGFSNGESYIGEPALDVAGKYPERVYTHFIDLLGKETVDHPSIVHYKTRFPYSNISNPLPSPLPPTPTPPSTDNNSSTTTIATISKSIILNHPEGLQFTPLELVAMMLQHAHDQVANVLKSSDQVATDVVITVPPYFNLQERQMVEDAAKLAGLNVLRLTNSNSAFALSYGIFRHHEYLPRTSDNKTTILFFDQGASQTSATLADYHLLEQQPPESTTAGANTTNELSPTVTVRAQVVDRYLGGFDMQLKLRDHLLENFCKLNKISESQVRSRGRSVSKLLKESGRVKKILSANTDHTVRVENVINDIDLKQFITRKEFEELNKEYLEDRIVLLLDRLFEMPNVSRDESIDSVIIVGGNTRTPKIQQTLQQYFKLQALGKSINGDEGAAMAALYQAASHGRGFRVKKFVLEEYNNTSTDPSSIQEVNPTDPETFEASRLKLSKLREKSQMRLMRLSLKNALESTVSEAKEKLSSENLDENLKLVKDNLEKEVRDTSLWLEESPVEETENVTILAEKLRSLNDLLNPPPFNATLLEQRVEL